MSARVAPQLRQELLNFCQGVVESFGVVLTWPLPPPAAGDSPPTQPSPPPPSETPTPVVESERTTDTIAGTPQRQQPPKPHPPAVRVSLMPSWSLIERDPKLWMLLRKSLLANLALAALTLLYAALAHSLASSSRSTARPSTFAVKPRAASVNAAGRALDEAATAGALGSAATSSSSSLTSSLVFLLLFWWVRLCLWMVKYVGQWPFYTLLQVIGLVWFSQLYRETWLVRKGWVLRGTGLRETAAGPSSSGPTTTTTTTASSPLSATHGMSASSSPAPPAATAAAGGAQPWLAPIALDPTADSGATHGTAGTWSQPLVVRTAAALARAAPHYVRHVAHLVARLLRHKGPTAVLQDWVLGDAAGAAAAAAASPTSGLAAASRLHGSRAAATATPPVPVSPDPFAAVLVQLESISEVLFKALATMSFALFASFVEGLPLVGTPLCVLLNAQLYAFYVFDYRYAAQQQPDAVHQRGSALTYQLRHFEQCSMYYAGYGIGSAVLSLYLTHHLGTVVSVCAMSVVYSWQVVWSGFAVPLPSSRPVPLFSVWFYVVDTTHRRYAVLWRLAAVAALLYLPATCVRNSLGYGA